MKCVFVDNLYREYLTYTRENIDNESWFHAAFCLKAAISMASARKSTLLETLICQDIKHGKGLTLLHPHRTDSDTKNTSAPQ
jgi:hypothetical protein